MANRSYGQHCGLAYALDLVGERWSLLIIRELLTGPKRFKSLLTQLPGIGPTLLTARLRKLTAEGIVHHATLPPPASVGAYALTDRGEALRPSLVHLTRWGLESLPDAADDEAFHPGSALMMLQAAFREEVSTGVFDEVEFWVGDDTFYIVIRDGSLETRLGTAPRPHCVIRSDPATFRMVLSGEYGLREAARSGRLSVSGGADTWNRTVSALDFASLRARTDNELPTIDLTGRHAPRPTRLR